MRRARSGARRITSLVIAMSLAGACTGPGGSPSSQAPTTTAGPPPTLPPNTAPQSPSPEPSLARCYAMTADTTPEHGTLLFGGWARPVADNDPYQGMSSYNERSGWSVLDASQGREPGDLFGYDDQSGRAVFVEVAGRTWGFDPAAALWEQRTPKDAPPAHGARMVYDAASDKLIAFGGDNLTGPLSDETWAYDYESDAWTKMKPAKRPTARSYFAMTYDSSADRVVLFGGGTGTSDVADTWMYDVDHDAWSQLKVRAGPTPRMYSAMAYDASTDRTILFGGVEGAVETPLGDTWSLDLSKPSWARLDIAGPEARGWHVMAADRDANHLLLFGGGPSRQACTDETWIFDAMAGPWSQVAM